MLHIKVDVWLFGRRRRGNEEGVTLQLYANEAELKPVGKVTHTHAHSNTHTHSLTHTENICLNPQAEKTARCLCGNIKSDCRT